ncbi:hypothetical protein [Psychroserpens jangbogonensis]|uniref:hypothetical protein n=1 Tax=Psychroserpens jangbogonensis TaxID=1484460 RepID=UPI00053EF079|nr:hypothetical protein [Psychroserpens jangbogonensis]
MKIIYLINKIALIITLALYLTIVFGLYAQIVLGAIQVICALTLFLFWKKFSNKTREQLYIYWTVVISYGLCWLIDWTNFNDSFTFIFGIIIVPMSIAIYFVYILRSTTNYIS